MSNSKVASGEIWVNNDADLYEIVWVKDHKVKIIFPQFKHKTLIVTEKEVLDGTAGTDINNTPKTT